MLTNEQNNVYTSLKRKRDKKISILLSITWNDLYFIIPIFLITLIPLLHNVFSSHKDVFNTIIFFVVCNVFSLLLAQEYKRIKIYAFILVLIKYYLVNIKEYHKKTKIQFIFTKINTKWEK